RSPYGLFGWLWFVGTLVPVIGLVKVGNAAMADRYTYIPSIGIFIAVVFAAQDLAKRFHAPRLLLPAVVVLMLAGCLTVTEKQLSYWRDSETLFRHAIAVTRDNEVAQVDLGVALDAQGRFAEAVDHYRVALRLVPSRYQVHNNTANALEKLG